MYRCILVPLDGTPFGEAALPLAASIARRTGAVLGIAHVHLPPIIPSGAETAALPPVWLELSWEEKKRYLEGVADRVAGSAGVRVETAVMEGSVAPSLERHALNCAAGLVVMSTHWHTGLSRLWHHGVADQLARDLPLPILLVRVPENEDTAPTAEDHQITNVLVPLDGSSESELILEHAATLARPLEARLTLVRVVDGGGEGAAETLTIGRDDQATALLQRRTAARQYLNGLAERLRRHGLEVVTEVLTGGSTAQTLLSRIANEGNAVGGRVDALAVAASERGAVSRLLFRAPVDELIREARVPVLLYEAPALPPSPAAARMGVVASA